VKADLTRNSFDPLKHFSRVLMQQGRVQLDADWNEQAGILLHLLRRLAVDHFGPAFRVGGGFQIFPLAPQPSGGALDFGIQPGTFYVDGVRCELEATPVPILPNGARGITVAQWTVDGLPFQVGQYLRLWVNPMPGFIPLFPSPSPAESLQVSRITGVHYDKKTLDLDQPLVGTPKFAQRIITYRTQPDLSAPPQLPATDYLIYLDVWERLVTCLEDDSIREVALNGPDTAARARVVWQVKALFKEQLQQLALVVGCVLQPNLSAALQPWTRGLLRARTNKPAQAATDPCITPLNARYRGAENQLYRVEIHTGNLGLQGEPLPGLPSFKWSRDNGAAIYPIVKLDTSGTTSTTVTLGNLGRDDRFGLAIGDYVEVQDDHSVLNDIPGKLLQVQSIERTSLVVGLTGTTTAGVGENLALHPLLRRWDHKSEPSEGGDKVLKDGAMPIPLGGPPARWLGLEDGVEVSFEVVPNVTTFRSGDYWLIPARVATGDVIWPSETQGETMHPMAKPPDGVTHHYASLAFVPDVNSVGQCAL
jgi:hypothetical protein